MKNIKTNILNVKLKSQKYISVQGTKHVTLGVMYELYKIFSIQGLL